MTLQVRLKMETDTWIGKVHNRTAWEINPIADLSQGEWQKDLRPRLRADVAKAGLVAYRRAYPDLHTIYRDGRFYCARRGPDCVRIVSSGAAFMGGAKGPLCPAPGCPNCPHSGHTE